MRLSDFKNKIVLIMGLGLHGGGVGSAAFFARLGSRVIVTDLKTRRELAPSIAKLKRFKSIVYHLGGHRPKDFKNADYVIKGPGVPDNSKFLKIAKRAGIPILSDVEIFFMICPAPIIGITGTKGKSTTATLLYRLIKADPRKIRVADQRVIRVWLAGNIRKSVLEILPNIRKNHLVILELSSFQLDSLKNQRLSPHIAVITNIFPDHLNRYASLRSYIVSKANIFRFQKPKDYLFINARNRMLKRLGRQTLSRVILFDPQKIARRFLKSLPPAIPGYHIPDIAAAISIARHLGVGDKAIQEALRRFRGLPGRMELVRKIRGIEFINDTTATNPGAAEAAVVAVKKRIGRHGLHMIAGGYDKGLTVRDFVRALRRYAATIIFLPGGASEKMKFQIQNPRPTSPGRPPASSREASRAGSPGGRAKSKTNHKFKISNLFDARSMKEAVRIACRNVKPGDVVLLSPGAASFGLFKHEFDRGEQFVKAVKRLR